MHGCNTFENVAWLLLESSYFELKFIAAEH
jgi:hypothetical protein